MKQIIEKIQAERQRQDKKWGVQNHPSIYFKTNPEDRHHFYRIGPEEHMKLTCNDRFIYNQGSWADIFLEEVSEVIHAPTPELMQKELIQVLAVGFAWYESIDRNEIKSNLKSNTQEISDYTISSQQVNVSFKSKYESDTQINQVVIDVIKDKFPLLKWTGDLMPEDNWEYHHWCIKFCYETNVAVVGLRIEFKEK